MLFYLVLALGIVSVVLFLVKRGPVVTPGIVIRKGVTSAMFLLTAAAASVCNLSCPALIVFLIVGGGIFGLLGDIWLDLKFVYPADNRYFLTAGFSCFLTGHVFYAFALVLGAGLQWYHILFGLAGALLVGGGTAFSEKILGVYYGNFKKLTVIYMCVLGGTVGLSVGAVFATHFSAVSLVFLAGMLLFLASDGLLAGIYFGEGKNRKLDITLNHALYYAAQFLLASTIYLMK